MPDEVSIIIQAAITIASDDASLFSLYKTESSLNQKEREDATMTPNLNNSQVSNIIRRKFSDNYFTSKWIGHLIFSAPRPINLTPSSICFPMAPASCVHQQSVWTLSLRSDFNLDIRIRVNCTLRVFIVINSWESISPAFIRCAIFPNPTGCQKMTM